MSKKSMWLVGCFCVSLVLFLGLKPATTQTSDSNGIPAEVQEFVKKMLESPAADLLSGSALTALNLLSGRVSVPEGGF